MLNRLNPLETVQRFAEGGEALLARPSEMQMPMEDMAGTEAPSTDDPLVPLYEVLGEEDSIALMEAMDMHPVVRKVAEMAIHTGDGLTTGLETGAVDEVPARVEPGEYIFSKEAVDVIGLENLEAMHEEAKRQAASM